MDDASLVRKLSEYSFYQTIDLGNGIKTPGLPIGKKQNEVLRHIESMDLSGKRVIDIGCANGLFAIAAEKRGAKEILAIDHTKQNIDGLNNLVLPHLGSQIKAIHLNLLDLSSEDYGKFDLVIFAGVLYHLRYPFTALKIIRDITASDGTMILETGIYDDFNTRAALYCPAPEDTPYKGRHGNSCSFYNEKALLGTLKYFGFKVNEKRIITTTVRRFFKKLAAIFVHSYYPTSNIVLRCTRDASIENENLKSFYELDN